MAEYDFSSVDALFEQDYDDPYAGWGDSESEGPNESGDKQNDSWQITKGFKAGVDQVQALGGGLTAAFGDALGVDSLKEWGLESYNQNMAEAQENQGNVQGFTDIEGFGDAVDWAMYTAGNMAPMLATSIAGGGAGGLFAQNLAKGAAQKIIAAEVAKGVAKKKAAEIAAKHIAKSAVIGAGAGAFSSSAGMETGSIYGDIQNLPGDNKAGVAFAHGAVAGALEFLTPFQVLKKLGVGKKAKDEITESVMKSAGDEITESMMKSAGDEITESVMESAGKQLMTEGLTEGMQTIVEQHAKYWLDENQGMFEPHHWKEIIDATAAGALMGGGIGVGTGLLTKSDKPTGERVDDAKQAAADAGGDALDQVLAGSEELVKSAGESPLESFGDSTSQQAEIEAIRQRRMDRLMDAQGNLDGEYFVRDKNKVDPSQAVDFEATPITDAQPLSEPMQPIGNEVDYVAPESLALEPMQQDSNQQAPIFENGLDFEPAQPQAFQPSRTDELAAGIEQRVRANDAAPDQPLLPAPDSIKLGGEVAPKPVDGFAGTGLDQMPENTGRMDSDPLQRNKERALGYDAERKKRTKAARQARLPEGLTDERWLREETTERPAYAQAVYDLADNVIKGGGISYLRNEHGAVSGRTKSLNPEWAQTLMSDEGVSTGYLKITAAKAMKGGKLTEKQARVITRMMDVVEATYNDPQNIEFVKQERVKKNTLRRAIFDDAQRLDNFEYESQNAPEPEILDIDQVEFDPRENFSQDEMVVIEALLEAEEAGISAAVTDELTLRFEEPQQLASNIQSAIRARANNDRRQEGDLDAASPQETTTGRSEEGSQATTQEEAGRNAKIPQAEAQRVGRTYSAGQPAGETNGQLEDNSDPLLSTYTEAELTQRDEQKKAAADAEAQSIKETDEKQKADKAVDSFDLTGSDRQADANPNQADLLDAATESSNGQANNKTESVELGDQATNQAESFDSKLKAVAAGRASKKSGEYYDFDVVEKEGKFNVVRKYKPTKEISLSRDVKVEETGEVVTIEDSAETLWRRSEKRGATLQKLLECVS